MKKAGKSEEEQAEEPNIFEHSAGSVYTIDAMAELARYRAESLWFITGMVWLPRHSNRLAAIGILTIGRFKL